MCKRVLVLAIVTVLCWMLPCYMIPVRAIQAVDIQWQTEEDIRPKKSFTVSLVFSAETDIGAVMGSVSYDSDRLRIISVTFRDKYSEDVTQYNDENGLLRFVLSGALSLRRQRMVDIRFQPLSDSVPVTYRFTVTEAQACDGNGELMTVSVLPELTLTVEETAAVASQASIAVQHSDPVHTASSDKHLEALTSRSVSQQTSTQSSRKTTSRTSSVSEEAEAPEVTQETAEVSADRTIIIREKDNTSMMTQGVFLALLGILLIVVALVFGAFWLGTQRAKKDK